MADSLPMTISAVERDTGLAKDTLRVWERRYGFPQPTRDAHGERLYPACQVERLRLIKRLIDQGYRPGRLLAKGEDDLLAIAAAPQRSKLAEAVGDQETVHKIIGLIKAHDIQGLRQGLSQAMMRQGLQRFVLDTVVPLNQSVGEAWMRGELQVFEEHLYSEQITSLLRQAISSLPPGSGQQSRLLMTTVPEEKHVLGLLMAECLLALEGATCISLGAQTPLLDIQLAAAAHCVDVVILSFSSGFASRQVVPVLVQLRELLPEPVQLWVGGAGVRKLRAIPGVLLLPTLDDALAALRSRQALSG